MLSVLYSSWYFPVFSLFFIFPLFLYYSYLGLVKRKVVAPFDDTHWISKGKTAIFFGSVYLFVSIIFGLMGINYWIRFFSF